MSASGVPRSRSLLEMNHADGPPLIADIRRMPGAERPPGAVLVSAATVLLGVLAAGLFMVSLAAQYRYIFGVKHQAVPSVVEAIGLDAGMTVFSLLALGLARAGQPARVERALIVACAAGSAAMNYAAADAGSLRSVAAYVMPPVFLAIVVDRVIAVVRRHVLGDAERSVWAAVGRAAAAAARAAGLVLLYVLRFVLAPPSTASGLRRWILNLTPLPAAGTTLEPAGARPDTGAGIPAARPAGAPAPPRPRPAADAASAGAVTDEAIEAHYAPGLDAGQVPSQKAIRGRWGVGGSRAKRIHGRLAAAAAARAAG
jgi:hypothetical protein